MKKMPAGFIIKPLLITETAREVMAKQKVLGTGACNSDKVRHIFSPKLNIFNIEDDVLTPPPPPIPPKKIPILYTHYKIPSDCKNLDLILACPHMLESRFDLRWQKFQSTTFFGGENFF